jgi:hypothetical protein
VAVVDISHVFKNHQRFKDLMEQMKQEVAAIEQQLRARHQDIETRRQKLNQFRPGTKEYKDTEAEIAGLQAQLQADTQLKRKELLEREAQVYYDIYTEVERAIKEFADTHGISLVLRFTGSEIDPSDRASVLQGVNRPVVYQRNLNITYEILNRLQRATPQRSAQAPPPPRGNAPASGRR